MADIFQNNVTTMNRLPLSVLLALMLFSVTVLDGAEPPNGAVPRQFQVLGTVVPAEVETIVMEGYNELDPPNMDLGPLYTPRPDDAQAGFRPYRRHYLAAMHPHLRPSPAALAMPEMTAYATWGEYEPMALGVFALRPLSGLTATVGDLVADQGERIPAACLDLRSVRYMPYLLGRNVWCRQPYILEKRPALTVPAGESVFFWLTAYVPPGTPGKTFRGQVTLGASGFPEQRVTVAFSVLPFALDETKKWFSMQYGLGPSGRPAQGDPYHCREEFTNFRGHGMNHLAYCQQTPDFRRGPDGKYVFDFDSIPSFREMAKKANEGRPSVAELIRLGVECGLDRAYFPHLHGVEMYSKGLCGLDWNTAEADQWFREFFKAWWDEAKKRNWPPIVYNIADEANIKKNDNLKVAVRLARLVKEGCPQLPTSAFTVGQFNGEDDLGAYGNALDYVIDGPYSQAYLDKVKSLGKKHMSYNQAMPDNRVSCRYSHGLMMETTGFLGHQQFRHVLVRKDGNLADVYRWYPKGGRANAQDDPLRFTYVLPTTDGLLNSPAFEAMREGVDDSRYIQTLRNLLASSNSAVSQGVRKEFEALMAAYSPFDDRGAKRVNNLIREAGPEGLDVARYRIACMIFKVRTASAPPSAPKK
ncbi:MAG: hypothetical protein NTY01_18485 [Verrucomicrobia bacterium]|nr:hypothetical protein [Verrucomicrobiota bacterium]